MNKIRVVLAALLLVLVSLFASTVEAQASADETTTIASVQVELAPPPGGFVALQNHWSNLCAAVNSTNVYTPIFQYWCGGQYPGQRFYFTQGSLGTEYWYLHSSYSGHCLGSGAGAGGEHVITWPCPGILVRPFVWPEGGWGLQKWSDSTRCVGIWPEDGNAVGDGLVWRTCNALPQLKWTIYPNV